VTIAVNDAPPTSVTYSSTSPFTLTKDVAMTTATPTSSGGTVVSWSITPTLPAGLSFDTSTGAISGTPTAITSSATYTVTASNEGGSGTTTVTIVVNDAAPSSLTYYPSSFNLAKDTAMTAVTPTSSGGAITSWSISPSLPAGLSFDTSTGAISGTPTVITAYASYTITASNTGGSDTATVTIIVNDAAPSSIAYSGSPFTLTKGVAMTSTTPTASGGTVNFWSISPTLPTGLSFDTSTGTISGTPADVSSSATYTVTATNAGGSDTASVTIQVNDVAPSSVAYSPSFLTLTKDTAMITSTPTSSGGTVVSWSISPSLTAGLTFDTSTGAVSGTPTLTSTAITYTVTATNSGGGATTTVTILVNDAAPSSVTYSPSSHTLTKDVAMTTVTPTASGGAVTSWSVTPSLPAGLSLDSSTGAISGTPTAVTSTATYTVSATNAGGTGTTTVTIEVNDVAPYAVSYSGTPFTLTKGTALTTVTPTASGGAVDSWSVTPALPSGLSLDTSTGALSGTPALVSSSTIYTITATNTGGSDTATVTIIVNDVIPSSIAYSGNPFTLTKDIAMTASTPTSSGGDVVTWQISPSLPAGLLFDTSTGEISGTPTAITSSATYTVTATNTGGSATTTVTIVVNDAAPSSVAFSGNPFSLTKDVTMTTATPTASGGVITSWSITPTLPAGLSFDSSTGAISGTPTTITSSATYTVTATNTGGSDSVTITIEVKDVVPSSITYNPSSFTLIKDSSMTAVTPTSSGGTVISWAVSPSLPAGLALDSSTGEISGTPTAITAYGTYTITASNTGGSATASITILVNDAAPSSLAYSASPFTLTKGSAMTSATPTFSGGTPTFWAISPTLPAGLAFDTSTGTLSGTPTAVSSSATYTLTATNAGGSDSTTFTLQVNDIPPSSVSYSPSFFSLANGTTMTAATPSTTGGAVTSWTISPTLPAGLTLSTTTGVISGTPTTTSSATVYTVTATNSGGGATTTLTLLVNVAPPSSVSYSPSSFTLTINNAMTAVTPTANGGEITSWSITPTLPAGLSFDTSTGAISGTPTTVSPSTSYTITATNPGGSDTATVTIQVNDVTPYSIVYSGTPFTLTKGTAMTSVTPTNSGGSVDTWSITPALPLGLSLDTSTGTLSGTPTVLTSSTTYTITAVNTGGSSTATVSIVINDVIPSAITYSGNPFTLTKDTAMTTSTPTSSGGTVTGWSITPVLPAGLSFDTSTGAISGTPTAITSSAAYTVTATNTGGSATDTVTIVVNDVIPSSLDYSGSPFTLTVGTTMTANTPTSNGGAITSWTVSPTLPAGLALDSSTGEISGTPTAITSSATYTVTASNTGGSDSVVITLVVNDVIPSSVVYGGSPYVLTNNSIMTADTPTSSGGTVVSWAISPSLPAGLTLDSSTGEISGTPTELSSLTTYTVTATNSGGISTATITIVVNDVVPTVSYSPDDLSMTNNTVSNDLPLAPALTGAGEIVSWTVSPALPSGLAFDTTTGTISGTATELLARSMFTITGTNTGGTATVYINLTIVDQVPTIAYSPDDLSMTNNTVSSDLPLAPTLTGAGEIVSWTISPALPSGLAFDTSTGNISGTATELLARSMFTITGTNTGGTSTAYINLTVVDELPTIAYSPDDLSMTNNTVSSDLPLAPSLTGAGEIVSWTISPTLPNGLAFDTSTGVLSGTPIELFDRTMFTVNATNTGGTATAYINITVIDVVPSVAYSPDDLSMTNNTVSSDLPLEPTLTGAGEIVTWTISPALPSGLAFDTSTGTISGTATELLARSMFVINGTNSGGTATTYVNITVIDVVPNVAYSPDDLSMINNTVSNDLPLAPTLTGAGEVVSWTISPALPNGLAFDTSTGVLSGTPIELFDRTMFTVNATNSGGTATAYINITVLDSVPIVEYVPSDFELLSNSSVVDMVPLSTGGAVLQWSITPELSAGLSFDNSTGRISGVPVEITSQTLYIITASNDDGSMMVYVNITVEDTVYDTTAGPIYMLDNSTIKAIAPISTISGSQFEIHPALPQGLMFNESNGTIYGTPTEVIGLTNFTIYSNSSLFNDSFTVQLQVLADTDGDSMPDQLPENYNSTGGLIEDMDDDGDGFTDADEGDCLSDSLDSNSVPLDLDGDNMCDALDDDIDGDGLLNSVEDNTGNYTSVNSTGTDPLNADTDDDGICDGPTAVNGTCTLGPDAFPNDDSASIDTDGDGMPDELIGNSTSTPPLVEDTDDDGDSVLDVDDAFPLDASESVDTDGDGTGDNEDTDDDGDSILDVNDAFPLDENESIDTDGDGTGDNEDTDDDDDGWSDVNESACGTDALSNVSTPVDTDSDLICDSLDELSDLPFNLTYPSNNLTLIIGEEMTPLLPNITGAGEVSTWELEGELPDGLIFGWSPARDAQLDGSIRGTPTVEWDLTTYTIWGNNSGYSQSYIVTLGVEKPELTPDSDNDSNDSDSNSMYALCCLPLLLLLLLAFLLRRKRSVLLDAEPEHTTSKPKCKSGSGTREDPFVVTPLANVTSGSLVFSKEAFTTKEVEPSGAYDARDEYNSDNEGRFKVVNHHIEADELEDDDVSLARQLISDEDGVLKYRLAFDDRDVPSDASESYETLFKVGNGSVYFKWAVEIASDKKSKDKSKKKAKVAAKVDKETLDKAQIIADATGRTVESIVEDLEDDGIVNLSNESNEQAEADAKATKEAKAKAEADAKAAKEAKAKAEADAKDAKDAKAQAEADAKAAKDVKAKAEADAKAAKDVKAKAEADAKAAKEAKAKEAKAKAEAEAKAAADAAKKQAAKKPATQDVKKQEELERVKSRADTIDFKTLGKATTSTLKTEVQKGATTLQVSDASEFEDAGSAAITDESGSSVISWTGKDGNALTGVKGVTRVFGTATVVTVKDDLQVIKGIGPFIEEKLNALGITTYRQIANMDSKLETQVNEAIEFFPGRVKRDQWANQAKILLGEDIKLDEKALQQAEELERISKKAESIDFATLGVATLDEKDDLQTIKGIGPFIEEKLNALGIYTFEQVGNMTPDIETQVNKAIEFFPGRVKRDEWAKQARELHSNKK